MNEAQKASRRHLLARLARAEDECADARGAAEVLQARCELLQRRVIELEAERGEPATEASPEAAPKDNGAAHAEA